jgi:uroporphyrin-III C-methyltransferase / precorrin-2 dehydrogenase / sirohydrochlorin ferrochelatase
MPCVPIWAVWHSSISAIDPDLPMDYLPLFVSLKDRPCLVVGGGDVALRKLRWLVETGGCVTLIATALTDEVREFAAANRVRIEERPFRNDDVTDQVLVIAATDDEGINRAVYAQCSRRNILVNTVDDQALCTAIFPAIIDRDPVIVAVSTGGASPSLARRIRGWIEAALPTRLGEFARLSGRVRDRVRARFENLGDRRRFWDDLIDGPVANLVYSGRDDEAESNIDALLAAAEPRREGLVSLVGGGPGDPELLTIRALRCMQQADVVLHDSLISNDVLALCRRDAKLIDVGKRGGGVSTRQEAINELMIERARHGERVVRLKGGDPFIFGRGGEEVESLIGAGIAFEVIPGITAASGCSTYAGIPLTHRDWAQSVRFVTGHLKDGTVNLDWPELARPEQTLVIYMGLSGVRFICENLIANGMDPETPAAVVAKGTMPDQRVVRAPLHALPEAVSGAHLTRPTTIIIGRVVDFDARRR